VVRRDVGVRHYVHVRQVAAGQEHVLLEARGEDQDLLLFITKTAYERSE
jgi:hypothetical protein